MIQFAVTAAAAGGQVGPVTSAVLWLRSAIFAGIVGGGGERIGAGQKER